jgi:crotonobetainyl-CoA:carnitine CoA-transferase CaiB-like acyl-CoA transferase
VETEPSGRAGRLLQEAWQAVWRESAARPALEVTGTSGHLPSHFAVEDTGVACVGVALLSAARVHESRGGRQLAAGLDRGQVAAAVRSERYFAVAGRPAGMGFAPLSRFFQAADGWVRTHANYPWHKQALLQALGAADDPEAVAAAMKGLPAQEAEDLIVGSGGVAAAVRSAEEWAAHPQGRAVEAEPLVAAVQIGHEPPRPRASGLQPASAVRVLDLTRAIAGPVATRFLGSLGADVLRLDPPRWPDLTAGAPGDSLLAKRSARLDASGPGGRAVLHALLDEADVLVCGYRPGALIRFGLGAGDLAEAHPGLVVLVLDAWGHSGPWSGRRGFDSIVQAASGIAMGESPDGVEPGALPCQLLDHGTGYLIAAAALEGLWSQTERGGTQFRYLSLARTAAWLQATSLRVSPGPPEIDETAEPERWTMQLSSASGPVRAVAPPGRFGGQPLQWPPTASRYGADEPVWLRRRVPGGGVASDP